jgi:hypothetical protein
MPLVVFNTFNLQNVYNYFEKVRSFERISVQDDEQLAAKEVPYYFQTCYIPDDRFLVLGGLERETNITSARCFLIDERGKLTVTQDMHVGRQYASVCLDQSEETVYAIGGFNSDSGLLSSFETFKVKARKWQLFG